MSDGFSIVISSQNTEINSFISEENDNFYLKTSVKKAFISFQDFTSASLL